MLILTIAISSAVASSVLLVILGGLFAGLATRGGLGDLLAAFEAVAFAEPALSLDRGRGAS